MNCPLCGYEFEETAMACHSSCMFNESCGIICCPNCGYQMPDVRRSRLAEALRRMLPQKRRDAETLLPVRPLSAMQPGQTGKVVAINSNNHARVERLHVLGLVDEAQLTLEQRSPTYVLKVGFTEMSVDGDIADDIIVEVAR